jgi:hypothetical protein
LRVSASVSKRRNGGFYAPVSASKISVPDSDVRDRFDDWVGGLAVRSLPSPPSSRSKPQISGPAPNRPFLWGFSPVSFRSFGLWWHSRSLRPISASRLCIQKFRSPQQGFDGQYRLAVGNIVSLGRQKKPCRAGRNYCGFNPSTSNCRLHSAGASRNRSTPIPRGSRPSTPARTRSGARNASEMVMLTWRTLHF